MILVHGIALQGTSPTAHYATKKYTISYQFNGKTIDYNNGKVKLYLKKFTFTFFVILPITYKLEIVDFIDIHDINDNVMSF